MTPVGFNQWDLLTWAALAGAASFLTAAVAPIFGSVIAYYAKPSIAYKFGLFLLFLPFAVGADVWALGAERVTAHVGLKVALLHAGEGTRAAAWFCIAAVRGTSLAVFYIATVMQARAAATRRYCRANKLGPIAFAKLVSDELPRSVVLVIALFSAAVVVVDSALPLHLYRANPGTGPDAVNLALLRLFREQYPVLGRDTGLLVLSVGTMIAMCLFMVSTLAAGMGLIASVGLHRLLPAERSLAGRLLLSAFAAWLLLACLCPVVSFVTLAGEYLHQARGGAPAPSLLRYAPLSLIALTCGLALVITMLAAAMILRLRVEHSYRASVAVSTLAVAGLFLFLPAASITSSLGMIFPRFDNRFALLAMVLAFVALLGPMVLALSGSLVQSIPEHRFSWLKTNGMKLRFVILVEGIRKNIAFCTAMVGLCAIQALTDGATARWFSSVVAAPAEEFAAAAFGRAASINATLQISLLLYLMAAVVSYWIAEAYVRELTRSE